MYKLIGKIQNYAWGKPASSSIILQINQINSGMTLSTSNGLDAETKLAEYWMGTHKDGMSDIVVEDLKISLVEFIKITQNKTNPELPFLFKVLTINKPLSIQVHPNKEFAIQLNNEFPNKCKLKFIALIIIINCNMNKFVKLIIIFS